jgi:hypothetical protein
VKSPPNRPSRKASRDLAKSIGTSPAARRACHFQAGCVAVDRRNSGNPAI